MSPKSYAPISQIPFIFWDKTYDLLCLIKRKETNLIEYEKIMREKIERVLCFSIKDRVLVRVSKTHQGGIYSLRF